MSGKYRLVTRSDFDGLVCALLLRELGLIDEILFVHPKDMQAGKIPMGPKEISTNLPYVPGVHLAFDHHPSEALRHPANLLSPHFQLDPQAPSTARMIYEHFGPASFAKMPAEMLHALDRYDSGQLHMDEILEPQGWILLAMLLDPRTGLERHKSLSLSNYLMMMHLIEACEKGQSLQQIFELRPIKERLKILREHQQDFRDQILRCTEMHGSLALLNLQQEEILYSGNRFMIYALWPNCKTSLHVLWGLERENTVIALGSSLFNRQDHCDLGQICLRYGGGGHKHAGTMQIAHEQMPLVLSELKQSLKDL